MDREIRERSHSEGKKERERNRGRQKLLHMWRQVETV